MFPKTVIYYFGKLKASSYAAATLMSFVAVAAACMKKSLNSRRYARLLKELRAARENAGLTQGEVCAKLDAHASFVSKVEAGDRRLDVVELADLCRIYKVSLVDILASAGIG